MDLLRVRCESIAADAQWLRIVKIGQLKKHKSRVDSDRHEHRREVDRRWTRTTFGRLLLVLSGFCLGVYAEAATFVVDSIDDAVDASPGNGVCATSAGQCTLRAAVQESNQLGGADIINIPAGIFALSITGTGQDDSAGDLNIVDDVIINGDAVNPTIIDANGIDRVFQVEGASATFSNLTIRNGNTTNDGGGILVDGSASLSVFSSTISGNTTTADGGGIATDGGTVQLTNVTVSGNIADQGGGLNCAGPCTLTNVTVTQNTGPSNGDGVRQRTGSGSITFLNSIVANNDSAAATECDGNAASLFSNGFNISSDTSCDLTSAGDQENTNPLLGLLQNTGGPTSTHALLTGSPAIDTGTNTGCPATDQRGFPRPVGFTCDIGAYEGAGVPICPVTTTADSGVGSLRACMVFANSNPGTPIRFNIPGPGNRSAGGDSWWAITPLTPLPAMTVAGLSIDGTTQTTNQGDTNSLGPEIELDGSLAGAATNGLVMNSTADGATVLGLQINRFGSNGIQIQSGANGVTIAGNAIGSDGSGASAPGNGNNGINLLGANATIGGGSATDRNIINNNGNEGINLTGGGATGNTIIGNYIGLESDGTSGSGNGDVGIAVLTGASGNTIGGYTAGERNVISMNFEGIEINSANNLIVGNYIGTDAGGTLDRGNRSDDGLEIQGGGNNNTVGGTAAGAANLIAFNQLHGVNVAAGTGNTILGNSIHSNDQLGIDLGNNGVTANDTDDPDAGANGLQNYPTITSVTQSGGTLTVDFAASFAAGDYRIEFFRNPIGADPSGFGEGQVYADAITVTDGGGGTQNFSHSFAGSVGDVITATATQEFGGPTYGSTSEFSGAVVAVAQPSCPGNTVNNTDDSGNRSLRECILVANSNPGTTIEFDIGGGGNRSAGPDTWHGITLLTPLPVITAANTAIDATTQTINRGDSNSRGPEIEIDGTSAGANADGLVVGIAADGATIRGLAIGNFSDNGILLLSDTNVIAGNYLGLSADGITPAGNNTSDGGNQGGIQVFSASNTIGGLSAADRNVISGNTNAGITLDGGGATGNQVLGNFVGVDASGTIDRGNTDEGIEIDGADNNTVGGVAVGARNIFSGNGDDGIEIDNADNNVVWNNFVGTDVSGALIIANDASGIDINDGADNNSIGGTGAADSNLVRGNSNYGVLVQGPSSGNAILGNQIFENGLLDIDLNNDGITANDPLDPDAGPNDLLNTPIFIAAAETSGTITAYFQMDVPAGDYRIEFFTNPSGAHGSGNGGGEVFAGARTISHAGAGVELFAHSFAGSALDVITATATESIGGPPFASTSEFSAAFTATLAAPFEARWPLDETSGVVAADILAGNDGTYQNGVLLDQLAACANTGNGVRFDGVDDFIEIPHSSDYLMNEGTVTFWANVDALGTAQGLFSKDSTGFDTGGHLTVRVQTGGDVEVRMQDIASSMFVNSAPITPGTWFHVAYSWGAGGMALYVDGAAPVTNPYVGGTGITSGGTGNFEPIAIGAATVLSGDLSVTPTQEHMTGFMDDVRIHNRALTLPEIQALASCLPSANLNIEKRAFWPDGTPIPTGAIIPSGVEFKYMLYINNQLAARSDVSVRDVLDPAFQYQATSIQVDNSVAECAAVACTAVEEQAIFNTVSLAAVLSDAVDGDVASYTAAGTVIDAGDANAANAQLNINGDSVWAILFSAKMP